MVASIGVYLYAAGDKTAYKGIFFSSFIGDTGYESNVEHEISPGNRPTVLAVFGNVVSAPGAYEFRLSLRAEVPGRSEPRQFGFAIPVRINAPNERIASTCADDGIGTAAVITLVPCQSLAGLRQFVADNSER